MLFLVTCISFFVLARRCLRACGCCSGKSRAGHVGLVEDPISTPKAQGIGIVLGVPVVLGVNDEPTIVTLGVPLVSPNAPTLV